jgi:peroxiredoxin
MPENTIYASYCTFKIASEPLQESERDVAAKEIADLSDSFSDRVEMRGAYSTAAFTADVDLMFWWVAESTDDVQDLLVAFRRTRLGRTLQQVHAFLGAVRPAEFTRDHVPAFAAGKGPKKYLCVYPFVRTPEWYLLEPQERARMLKEHGELARDYADVQPNTTSAFGLGDYEWILAFEADAPERIVDLIRALRAAEARRFTKEEVPFVTGIRKPIDEAITDLP